MLLLQESPARVELVDPPAGRVIAGIDLVIPMGHPLAASWADPGGSRGEGAVVLANGHLLIAKEKDPAALIEFGPAGEAAGGFRAAAVEGGAALPGGFAWPVKPGEQSFVLLAWWAPDRALARACHDLSDLEVGPDGSLYVLSDKSQSVARVGDLDPRAGIATAGATWELPHLDGKPEGLAFTRGRPGHGGARHAPGAAEPRPARPRDRPPGPAAAVARRWPEDGVSPIPVIRASGTPYERGLAIGRALADPIRRSAAYNLAHFARRGLDRAAIEALTGPLLEATRRGLPHELAALHGMADGAGLPLLDVAGAERLRGARSRTPISGRGPTGPARRPPGPARSPGPSRAIERCSALAVAAPGLALLGHNEQWLANEPGDVAVVVEIPDDPAEPAIVSPTCASWRPAVGMTSTGHAQAVMSLTARDDRPGIPRVLVSRSALSARDAADARARATPVDRSGGYAYLHAFRGGTATVVETTATREALVGGPAVHTNHYLDPELAALGAPPSAGSLARHARLAELVAAALPATPADVMAILADHGSAPSTICLHPDPADGDDAEAVIFAMVCDLQAGRMWVAPGRPCEVPFEEFDLAELLADAAGDRGEDARSPLGRGPRVRPAGGCRPTAGSSRTRPSWSRWRRAARCRAARCRAVPRPRRRLSPRSGGSSQAGGAGSSIGREERRPGDQARAPAAREEAPRPADDDDDPIGEADQVEDVDHQPERARR